MRKLLLVFLFSIWGNIALNATHIMGGEITWKCQGSGFYVFTLKVYRDCNGVPLQFPVFLRVHNHPSVNQINMNLVSQIDISPQCNGSGPSISCSSPNPGNGAVEEFVFQSPAINLSGVPPPQGWVFTFDNCCRNSAISNLVVNGTQTGITIRAKMFSNGGQNTTPCFDSSPVFAQRPATIICAGNPFTYNHNAFDEDLDSLVYSFAPALDWLNGASFGGASPPAIPYFPGYTANSPFPDQSFNANNIPASINPQTGEISFTPFTIGNFVTVIKVESYKCGVLVAEIYREIQVVVLSCGANFPPIISAPFQNPQGLYVNFTDTVTVGDMVNFTITANDNGFLPTGFPQTIRVLASGGQFGQNFTNTIVGCTNPPCATLNPAPPVTLNNNGSITFNWETSCDHINYESDCIVRSNTHTFVLLFQDDYCPAPSYTIATVSVVVNALPVIDAPSLRCLQVQNNGDVQLTWVIPADPTGIFNSYHVYSSLSPAGPFAVVDSIFNYNQTTYTHVGADANTQARYYYLRSRSGCYGAVYSENGTVLQTIFLQVNDDLNGNIALIWNALVQPPLSSTGNSYTINKKVGNGNFNLLGNTANLTFPDIYLLCQQDFQYQVRIPDNSGCFSTSNIIGDTFRLANPPLPITMDSVTVNLNGEKAEMAWNISTAGNVVQYIIYQNIGNQWVALDTLNTVDFANFNSQAGLNSESYAVAPVDSCGLIGPLSTLHNTIKISYIVNACENRVNFDWNSYLAWNGNIAQTQIIQWLNGSTASVATTLNGNPLNAQLNNLLPSGNYCFAVRVFHNDGRSSTSDTICFAADVLNIADFTYCQTVSVVNSQFITSSVLFDATADVNAYKVLRGDYPGGALSVITEGLLSGNTIIFNDPSVNPNQRPYYYQFQLIDLCDNVNGESNFGRSIFLRSEAREDFKNELNWNTYGDWDAGVGQYQVWRSFNNTNNFTLLATLTANDSVYVDDVVNELDKQYRFCYKIKAVEAGVNSYNIQAESESNHICVNQSTTIYIPNAFSPSNTNIIFKPLGLFENSARAYSFQIYNRWGEQIFNTTDTKLGWNGKYKDVLSPSGIYSYKINFNLPDGSNFNKIGSVLLIE